jgi:CBS domain containing-hemolysin-like protein
MSQYPMTGEPNDSEPRALPALAPRGSDPPAEGWLSHIARILFGWKSAATRADLEHVLTAGQPAAGFSPEEAAMLKNILTLREYRIERVMVPRADIIAVQQDVALGRLLHIFANAGHSRLVVYNDTLDDPTGMVHIRDLVAFMAPRAGDEPDNTDQPPARTDINFANIDLSLPLAAAKIVREILYAPPSMPALDLLAKMQATRIHLSLVIDEYGGTDGLVSMEDLVELIVGDIDDEHDVHELPAVTRQSDGSFLAGGRASLEDVRAVIGDEFDVGDAEGEVDTLSGYLVIRAGHVPVRGELVPGPGSFEAEVLDADPRRIKRVKIYRRKDRRPAAVRDLPAPIKTPAPRSTATPEEPSRPTPNSQNSP